MSSWWQFWVKDKYPGKYAIVPEVIQFCLSSELFKELDRAMASEGADGGMAAANESSEFKLAYTQKHEAFVAAFEKRLEEFIVSKKSTPAEFYELCKTAQEAGDENIEAFITVLTQVMEFQSFVDLCRDAKKRAYVQGVLAQYAKMLTSAK